MSTRERPAIWACYKLADRFLRLLRHSLTALEATTGWRIHAVVWHVCGYSRSAQDVIIAGRSQTSQGSCERIGVGPLLVIDFFHGFSAFPAAHPKGTGKARRRPAEPQIVKLFQEHYTRSHFKTLCSPLKRRPLT